MPLFRKSTRPGKSARKETRLLRETIPTDAVRLGMHVVDLDRPWSEVPVLFQQFVINTPEQLAILREYCLWVIVELTQDQYRLVSEEKLKSGPITKAPSLTFSELKPLAEELPHARLRYGQAQHRIDSLLDRIGKGEDFSLEGVRDIVKNCVTSIANNANAMFWLTRIRHRDAYTAEHCVRVGLLAITFGRFLGYPDEDLEILGLCGMLHDVGKMRVPAAVLNKPGALSPDEWDIMRNHAQYGYDLLGSHHELDPVVRNAALSHHERLDGKGYPNGLPGPAIEKFTRIVTIIDAYDAMTSDRPYHKGIPTAKALGILYKNRGNQFDDHLVEVFIRMIGVYPPGSLVELNTGEVAIVLATSPKRKLHPLVELVLDANGHRCESRVLNLSEEPLSSSGQPYTIARALPDGVEGFSLAEHIRHQSTAPDAAAGLSNLRPEPR